MECIVKIAMFKMPITDRYEVKVVCAIHASDFWTSTFKAYTSTANRCASWKPKQPGVLKGQEIVD